MPGKRAMPRFTKAPDSLVATFGEALEAIRGADLRKMFGYPAAFSSASGQMFSSLFQDHMILRLEEGDRGAFLEKYRSRLFEPIPGRPMREYVEVPETLLRRRSELLGWLEKSRAYAASLPKKASRGKKKAR